MKLHGRRPIAGLQRVGNQDHHGQQSQIEQHQKELRPRAANPTNPQLRPTVHRETKQQHQVIDRANIGIGDDDQQRDNRQGPPTGLDRQRQTFLFVGLQRLRQRAWHLRLRIGAGIAT